MISNSKGFFNRHFAQDLKSFLVIFPFPILQSNNPGICFLSLCFHCFFRFFLICVNCFNACIISTAIKPHPAHNYINNYSYCLLKMGLFPLFHPLPFPEKVCNNIYIFCLPPPRYIADHIIFPSRATLARFQGLT